MQTDVDEEDRYSGVIREPSPVKKTTTTTTAAAATSNSNSSSSSKSNGSWKRAAPHASAASSSSAATAAATVPVAAAAVPESVATTTTGSPAKQLLPTPPGIFSSPTSSLDTWEPVMQKNIPHLPSVPISTFQGGADRADVIAPLHDNDSGQQRALGHYRSDPGAATTSATTGNAAAAAAVPPVMEASLGSLPPDELQFRPQTDVGAAATVTTDGMSASNGFPLVDTSCISVEVRPQPVPTKALNPSAKEWKPNVNAAAWVPKQADPPQIIPVSPQMQQLMYSHTHTPPHQQQQQQGFVPDMMTMPVFSGDPSPQGPMLYDPGMPTQFPPHFMPPPYYAGEYMNMMAGPHTEGQPYMMPIPIPLDGIMPQMLPTDYFLPPNYPGPHMMAPPPQQQQQNYSVPPNQMPMGGNYPQYTQHYPTTGGNNNNNNNNNIPRQMK